MCFNEVNTEMDFTPRHVAAFFSKLCHDEFCEDQSEPTDEDGMVANLLFEKLMKIKENYKVEVLYENVQEGKLEKTLVSTISYYYKSKCQIPLLTKICRPNS